MSRQNRPIRPAETYPDAERVGDHFLIEKTQWVPGGHPEPWMRNDPQRGYFEGYFYCLHCGAERLSKGQFPELCPDASPAWSPVASKEVTSDEQ